LTILHGPCAAQQWQNRLFPSYLSCASFSTQFLVQNLSYGNEFDLHENEPIGETHFHMNAF